MKKVISLLLCLLLIPVLSVQAEAPLLLDHAGLMDIQQNADLSRQLKDLQAALDMDIVILTTGSLANNTTPEAYADGYLEQNHDENGLLFLLDMGSRSWHISTQGTAAERISEDDLDEIEAAVIPLLANGQYYAAFDTLLSLLADLAAPGEEASPGGYLLICAVPGAVIAAVILAIMVSMMNSRKPRHSAADYTQDGSFHLRSHSDLFLYSNVTKRAKPKETKSGSTTHRSASGRTHGGRGGKF